MTAEFVPPHFPLPTAFEGAGYRLEPLGPEHNERDHAAWMSSIEHIRATPGFADWDWPEPMSLAENLRDLEEHAADFASRTGFTYSIIDGDDVIGCLYIYPTEGADASVRSWVTEDRAELDVVVWRDVTRWLRDVWPFDEVRYASRATDAG